MKNNVGFIVPLPIITPHCAATARLHGNTAAELHGWLWGPQPGGTHILHEWPALHIYIVSAVVLISGLH